LRISEKRVLRQIFGLKREEVTGGWRKLREELNNFYPSPCIIRMMESRRMRLMGPVACTGENLYKILVRKPDGKRSLG
jgi:hypothetical protein